MPAVRERERSNNTANRDNKKIVITQMYSKPILTTVIPYF